MPHLLFRTKLPKCQVTLGQFYEFVSVCLVTSFLWLFLALSSWSTSLRLSTIVACLTELEIGDHQMTVKDELRRDSSQWLWATWNLMEYVLQKLAANWNWKLCNRSLKFYATKHVTDLWINFRLESGIEEELATSRTSVKLVKSKQNGKQFGWEKPV